MRGPRSPAMHSCHGNSCGQEHGCMHSQQISWSIDQKLAETRAHILFGEFTAKFNRLSQKYGFENNNPVLSVPNLVEIEKNK